MPAWAVLLTIAIAVGFAVWQALESSQQLIVDRDPGGYLQYAYWIAHHGAARIPVNSAAFGSAAGPAAPACSSPARASSPMGRRSRRRSWLGCR